MNFSCGCVLRIEQRAFADRRRRTPGTSCISAGPRSTAPYGAPADSGTSGLRAGACLSEVVEDEIERAPLLVRQIECRRSQRAAALERPTARARAPPRPRASISRNRALA